MADRPDEDQPEVPDAARDKAPLAMSVLSITYWLPRYCRSDLRYKLLAGVTAAALLVPKALDYAGIALVPIENGLYAAGRGARFYALFGTSWQVSAGPSSALAAVAASAVLMTGLQV